jgi:hypothetical protein
VTREPLSELVGLIELGDLREIRGADLRLPLTVQLIERQPERRRERALNADARRLLQQDPDDLIAPLLPDE